MQKLRELAEQLTEHTERPILGMGISTVGVISSDASGIAYVTDFFGIRSLNLRDALQPYFRFPIIVCNDMHASGLCELYFGAGKDADSFLYMGITEGLGAALVSHHELLDACGELGHTSIDFGGPRCTCGSRGCLELYASAPAILSLIHDECGVELDSMEQAAGFAMTNKAAYTVFYNAMRQLSFGLNNYLNLVNVSLVVLGHDAAFCRRSSCGIWSSGWPISTSLYTSSSCARALSSRALAQTRRSTARRAPSFSRCFRAVI